MRAKWSKEVRNLLGTAEFRTWWGELSAARRGLVELRDRYDELLTQRNLLEFRSEMLQKKAIDTLYVAGELEDQAAAMLAEAQEADNRSYEAVGEFEQQRLHVSELWGNVGAAESHVLKRREEHETAKKRGGDSAAAKGRLEEAEREYRRTTEKYEAAEQRKKRLWDEVEELWSRSIELALLTAERQKRSEKVRAEAQRQFADAEEARRRSQALEAENTANEEQKAAQEARITALVDRARAAFDCVVEGDFLYWQQREDQKCVHCVALIDDDRHYNLELRALGIYHLDRQRGVTFIEPARPEGTTPDDADQRLDEFFAARPTTRPGHDKPSTGRRA